MYEFQVTKCDACGYQSCVGDEEKLEVCPDCGREVDQVLMCISKRYIVPDNASREDVFVRFHNLGVQQDFWFDGDEIQEFEDRWNVPAFCDSSTTVKYITLYKKSSVENYIKRNKHVS